MGKKRILYQPHRRDLFINTDWGVPKVALSKEEAHKQELVLFKAFWVTKDQKKLLKDQYHAYHTIRVTAVLMFISGLISSFVSIPDFHLTLNPLNLCIGVPFFIISVGIYQYKNWARKIGTVILIITIPTIMSILCLYYLNRKTARQIFKPYSYRVDKPIDKSRVDDISKHLESKDSSTLHEILIIHDTAQYTEEAFEAIRRILSLRKVNIPDNKNKIDNYQRHNENNTDDLYFEKKARNFIFYLILISSIIIVVTLLAIGEIGSAVFWSIVFLLLILPFSKTRGGIAAIIDKIKNYQG